MGQPVPAINTPALTRVRPHSSDYLPPFCVTRRTPPLLGLLRRTCDRQRSVWRAALVIPFSALSTEPLGDSAIVPVFVYVFAVTDGAFSIVATQAVTSRHTANLPRFDSVLLAGAPYADVARPHVLCAMPEQCHDAATGNWYYFAAPATDRRRSSWLWVDPTTPQDGTRLQVRGCLSVACPAAE